jgi:hypothetical protein
MAAAAPEVPALSATTTDQLNHLTSLMVKFCAATSNLLNKTGRGVTTDVARQWLETHNYDLDKAVQHSSSSKRARQHQQVSHAFMPGCQS